MPGYGWSISAFDCKTGGVLHRVTNSPCFKCYARRGRYRLPETIQAMDKRLSAWEDDIDWVALMAIRLLYLSDKTPFFRWFDSGDLQSEKMAEDINEVCLIVNPHVQCWLPTQERFFISTLSGKVAPNLTIRVSSTKVDIVQHSAMLEAQNSYVVPAKVFETATGHKCPSHTQANKCGSCRACWDKLIPLIAYRKH